MACRRRYLQPCYRQSPPPRTAIFTVSMGNLWPAWHYAYVSAQRSPARLTERPAGLGRSRRDLDGRQPGRVGQHFEHRLPIRNHVATRPSCESEIGLGFGGEPGAVDLVRSRL
jgi:hypothetical protein